MPPSGKQRCSAAEAGAPGSPADRRCLWIARRTSTGRRQPHGRLQSPATPRRPAPKHRGAGWYGQRRRRSASRTSQKQGSYRVCCARGRNVALRFATPIFRSEMRPMPPNARRPPKDLASRGRTVQQIVPHLTDVLHQVPFKLARVGHPPHRTLPNLITRCSRHQNRVACLRKQASGPRQLQQSVHLTPAPVSATLKAPPNSLDSVAPEAGTSHAPSQTVRQNTPNPRFTFAQEPLF